MKSKVKSARSIVRTSYSYLLKILPKRRWLRITLLTILALVTLTVGSMYVVARWYIADHANQPLQLGASFIPAYAEKFGLDPQQTLDAMINDLGVKNIRLVSYWEDIEPEPGTYDFSQLDWQFAMAQ